MNLQYNLKDMKKLLHKHLSLIIILTIYLISIVLMNPIGEYAVNDDWDFITHVRNFMQGDFVKNSLIDSSFVLQGLIGAGWCTIFGLNFISLKILTILTSMLTIIVAYKLLGLFCDSRIKPIILLLITFNPFFYMSSTTFMTENYFLLFTLLSVYFYVLHNKTKNNKYFFFALLLGASSILIRQFGILLMVGLILHQIVITRNIKKITLSILFLVVFAVTNFSWPQYNSDNELPIDIITGPVTNLKATYNNALTNNIYILPYIGFITLPLGLNLYLQATKKTKLFIMLATILMFNVFYKVNLFRLGNVLYPEGLFLKTNPITHMNLFNNNIFKVALLFTILISACTIILRLLQKTPEIIKNKNEILTLFAILLIMFIFPITAFSSFDRYYIYGFIFLLLLLSGLPSKYNSLAIIMVTILYCTYNYILTNDAMTLLKKQWHQASMLRQVRQINNTIFLNGTYTKFNSIFYKPNNANITQAMPRGIDYQCYIQPIYEATQPNLLYKALARINDSRTVNNFFINPKIYEWRYSPGYREPTKDATKILFKEKIRSLADNIIGIDVFVITYCETPH